MNRQAYLLNAATPNASSAIGFKHNCGLQYSLFSGSSCSRERSCGQICEEWRSGRHAHFQHTTRRSLFRTSSFPLSTFVISFAAYEHGAWSSCSTFAISMWRSRVDCREGYDKKSIAIPGPAAPSRELGWQLCWDCSVLLPDCAEIVPHPCSPQLQATSLPPRPLHHAKGASSSLFTLVFSLLATVSHLLRTSENIHLSLTVSRMAWSPSPPFPSVPTW
jgi:hypothetical protein